MINALKHPSFFRPTSRPASPVTQPSSASSSRPTSSNGLDRTSRSLHIISLSNFRRSSSGPLNPAPSTLVQDGSYLEVLSLKLSEAVSKALAQPTGPVTAQEHVAGKRPIPQGRGRALGALIASEFKATQGSPHLHRAILRSLQRPLSVLLTNLSANLLPLISSPAFHSAPVPTVQNPNPNPTQVHALAIASFVEELLETFDTFDLGTDVDVRGDSLKAIRDGLVSLINRVVNPLVAAIHKELVPILEALDAPNVKPINGVKASPFHPSIVALQATMPVYARALARYTTSPASQATLATFLISVVWRGLVALAHRPYSPPSPPASPGLTPLSTNKSRSTMTPPLTPPAGRFTIKLPPSRPPSPPFQVTAASTTADAKALLDLLNLLPRPSGDKEPTRLAAEAVDDAFEGLKALPPLLDAVHSVPPIKFGDSQHHVKELACELEHLATKVPVLIALPVLLQTPVFKRSPSVSVSGLIGLSETEYRNQCMSGFGRAEECATTVASRVLFSLRSNADIHPVVSKWLEMEIAEALETSSPF